MIGGSVIGAVIAAVSVAARAQPIDPARPHTIVVGTPAGPRADRVDAARSGFSRSPLPASGLHSEWKVSTGGTLDSTPVVDARGAVYVVSSRGEAIAVARDGVERWRVPTGAVDPGPTALLSDDTLVLVDGAGDVVAIRDGAVRWRSHVGVASSTSPAPLPLDDGGVVVATTHDLALLDSTGRSRASVVLPEPTAAPLLWAGGKVIVVSTSGSVWTWVPGTAEPERVAAFGSPIAGGAALVDARTLVAVVAGQTSLAAVDLAGGTRLVRAVAPGGLWLGPPTVSNAAGGTLLALFGASGEVALSLDSSGRELGRAVLGGRTPSALQVDGGAASVAAGLTDPMLVDAAGTVVFGTLEGGLGAAVLPTAPSPASPAGAPRSDGSVEVLADACPKSGGFGGFGGFGGGQGGIQGGVVLGGAPAPVAGLAPLTPASFVAACRAGVLVAVSGAAGVAAGGAAGERIH